MAYFVVGNFNAGIDVRKHPLVAPAGTLRALTNGHITPGGEIEKRRAFFPAFDLASPPDAKYTSSFGLAALEGDLYVFADAASVASAPVTWTYDPTGVGVGNDFSGVSLKMQVLTGSDYSNGVPGALPLDRLVDWDEFDGKLYLIAQGGPYGEYEHFYDGARVTDINARGRRCITHNNKVYAIEDRIIRFSTVLDPTDWTDTTTGAGFIQTSASNTEGGELTGMEIYYRRLAVFSKSGVQIWAMDVDPANNELEQTIRTAGLAGAAKPQQYGAGDVIFLSRSGVRSLYSRDSSISGAVTDIGSPIDELIQKLFRENYTDFTGNTNMLLEQHTGRLWLTFPDHIWVLSQFETPGVSAWSKYTTDYEGTAFTVQYIANGRNQPCIRGTDGKIYVYGGATGDVYDKTEIVAELPFLTMDRPADWKNFTGIDLTCEGEWDIEFKAEPEAPVWAAVGRARGQTLTYNRIGFDARSPFVSLRLSSTDNVQAKIANVVFHYRLAGAD